MSRDSKDNWENYNPSLPATPGIGNNNLGVAKVCYFGDAKAKGNDTYTKLVVKHEEKVRFIHSLFTNNTVSESNA